MSMHHDLEDRIDDLLERVDALFPKNDHGFGDAYRKSMDAVEYHAGRFSRHSAESILMICEELLGVMERTQRELAEMDEWADKCEAESTA